MEFEDEKNRIGCSIFDCLFFFIQSIDENWHLKSIIKNLLFISHSRKSKERKGMENK